MSRRDLRGLRGLVTGASGGIGRELARALAGHGTRLLLTARRGDRLAELEAEICRGGGAASVLAGDVTDAAFRARLIQAAVDRLGGLDLLINNAGVGAWGPFAAADETRLRRVMEVNFFAPAELTRLAIPWLRQGRQPLIVNVGSVLGHRAVPHKSEYCASKFALHGLSDALRAELAELGIDLLLVSPSTTDTEFFDNVLENQAAVRTSGRGSSPRAVARCTIRAIRSGRHEIILTLGGKLLVWLDRLCPPLMNRLIARYGR
jgi:short-subunit dehydrogenase